MLPIGLHDHTVAPGPEELTHGCGDNTQDPSIFQVAIQLGNQRAVSLLVLVRHGALAKAEARLIGQWFRVPLVMTLGISQDGAFTFQAAQTAEQHQYQNQTVL